MIFSGSPSSAAADIRSQARRLRLNASAFDECLAGSGAPQVIQANKSEAAKLGITATPAFLVGTLKNGEEIQVGATIVGAKPYDDFRAVIEDLLKVK